MRHFDTALIEADICVMVAPGVYSVPDFERAEELLIVTRCRGFSVIAAQALRGGLIDGVPNPPCLGTAAGGRFAAGGRASAVAKLTFNGECSVRTGIGSGRRQFAELPDDTSTPAVS